MKDNLGKIIAIVAIVFMGMTAAMNILGGIGTVCAAFLTKQFPPMWSLLDYQWLYQIIMIVTIGLGLVGAWVTIKLIRGGNKVYRNAVIVLAAGTLVAAVQFIASLALRGKAVPANMKFYINAITLLLFLLLRLPGVRERVDFSRWEDESGPTIASGLTAILTGMMTLTTGYWVGASHIYEGFNWVNVLRGPMVGSGLALIAMGIYSVVKLALKEQRSAAEFFNPS